MPRFRRCALMFITAYIAVTLLLNIWPEFTISQSLSFSYFRHGISRIQLTNTTKETHPSNTGKKSLGLNISHHDELRRIFPLTMFEGLTNREEQEKRKRKLEDLCATGIYPTKLSDLSIREKSALFVQFLVCDEHKFIYCYVQKVSCTNWRRVLLVLQNVTQEFTTDKMLNHPKELNFLIHYSDEEIEYRLKNYYKFVFVRNPLERLLSAFRNRLKEVEYVIEEIGVHIKRKYGNYVPSKNDTVVPGSDVTYEEYVRYLLDEKELDHMDPHWAPMHVLTQPCLMKYDYIGSFDHLYDDAEFVLRSVNAPARVHFPGRQAYYNPTTHERVIKYHSQVKTQYMKKLVEKYRNDFLLYSYPIPNLEKLLDLPPRLANLSEPANNRLK